MAVCTPPTSLSPGFLFIRYTHRSLVQHTARWALIDSADISNIVDLRTEAGQIALKMADALVASFLLDGWGTMNRDGSVYYEEPFAAPIGGTHGAATGAEDYLSRTVTFSGKGNATAPGVCAGKTRTVLFVGSTYQFAIGQKRITAGSDAGLLGYFNRLNLSLYLPADDYGQQVLLRSSGTVQFNAHTQRKEGS